MTAFDIIVVDVMLPFLDGLEVAKRLRFQNIRTPILPVGTYRLSLLIRRGTSGSFLT
jgi:DNA-binding response OmpR family regulator